MLQSEVDLTINDEFFNDQCDALHDSSLDGSLNVKKPCAFCKDNQKQPKLQGNKKGNLWIHHANNHLEVFTKDQKKVEVSADDKHYFVNMNQDRFEKLTLEDIKRGYLAVFHNNFEEQVDFCKKLKEKQPNLRYAEIKKKFWEEKKGKPTPNTNINAKSQMSTGSSNSFTTLMSIPTRKRKREEPQPNQSKKARIEQETTNCRLEETNRIKNIVEQNLNVVEQNLNVVSVPEQFEETSSSKKESGKSEADQGLYQEIDQLFKKYQIDDKCKKKLLAKRILEEANENETPKEKKEETQSNNFKSFTFHDEFCKQEDVPSDISDFVKIYNAAKSKLSTKELKTLDKAAEILRKKMKEKVSTNRNERKEEKEFSLPFDFVQKQVDPSLIAFIFDVSCNDYNANIFSVPPKTEQNWGRMKKKINGACVISNQIFNQFNQNNGSYMKTVATINMYLGGLTTDMINSLSTIGLCQPMDSVFDTLDKSCEMKTFVDDRIVLPNIDYLKLGAYVTMSDNCDIGTSSVVPFGCQNTQLSKELMKLKGEDKKQSLKATIGMHDLGLCWTSRALTIPSNCTLDLTLPRTKPLPKTFNPNWGFEEWKELEVKFSIVQDMICLTTKKMWFPITRT